MSAAMNPVFEFGHGKVFVRQTLTEICHDAGMRARWNKGSEDAYYEAYYATLRKLCPDHPALEHAS